MANELRETKEQLAQMEAQAKQKNVDFARKLKAMNMMTTEQIAEVTGLSNAEIEAL
jgi:hypothetical protein